ncbi:hypothetical protein H4R33_004630 [Dimargaris cristalligena]|nr:hypothetical protein H4R33_004630 [Dimargaris cristalligena]
MGTSLTISRSKYLATSPTGPGLTLLLGLFDLGNSHLGQGVIRHLDNRDQLHLAAVCPLLRNRVMPFCSLSFGFSNDRELTDLYTLFINRHHPFIRRLYLKIDAGFGLLRHLFQSDFQNVAASSCPVSHLHIDIQSLLYWNIVPHYLGQLMQPPRMLTLAFTPDIVNLGEFSQGLVDGTWPAEIRHHLSSVRVLRLYPWRDSQVNTDIVRVILEPFTGLRRLDLNLIDVDNQLCQIH